MTQNPNVEKVDSELCKLLDERFDKGELSENSVSSDDDEEGGTLEKQDKMGELNDLPVNYQKYKSFVKLQRSINE